MTTYSAPVQYLPWDKQTANDQRKAAQALRILRILDRNFGCYVVRFETGYREAAWYNVYVIANDCEHALRRAKAVAHNNGKKRMHDYPRQVRVECLFTPVHAKLFT